MLKKHHGDGGTFDVETWATPAGWTPPTVTAHRTEAPADDTQDLPDWEEAEMANLLRLRKRLYGGSTVANLKLIAVALGLSRSGNAHVLKTRIEVKLRALRFEDDTEFAPTADDMELSDGDFNQKFAQSKVYSIGEVQEVLRRLAGA